MAFWTALDELIDDLIMADDEEEHCEEEEMLESQDEEVASLHHRTTKNIMEITETDEEEVSSLSKRSTRFGNMNTKQIICRLLPVFVIAVGVFIVGTYYGVSNKDNSMSDEETLPTTVQSSIGNNNIDMEEPPPANDYESGQAVLNKHPIEAAGDEEPAILPSTIVNTFTVLEQISHDPTSFA